MTVETLLRVQDMRVLLEACALAKLEDALNEAIAREESRGADDAVAEYCAQSLRRRLAATSVERERLLETLAVAHEA